jgi:hypothetical protein
LSKVQVFRVAIRLLQSHEKRREAGGK